MRDSLEQKVTKDPAGILQTERFTVDSVICNTTQGSVTPKSEMRIGGRSPSYNTGYFFTVNLKVTPEKDIPVRELVFYGNTPVVAGSKIIAEIARADEKGFYLPSIRPYERGYTLYTDRPYKTLEKVLEIKILGANEEILRTDRSVEYYSHHPKTND